MTCGLYGGIEVAFLKSGLSITPYEVRTRSGDHEFSYTKVDISREDGELISEQAKEYEPVLLKLDGQTQDRYVFRPEAVSLNNNSAKLTLYDAEKILERGTVNKHFQNTSIKDVINYIVRRTQDPNRVIRGIAHSHTNTSDVVVQSPARLGREGILGDALESVTTMAAATFGVELTDTSLKLTDMSPLQALNKVASTFSLETWVDPSGMLNYGLQGTNPNSLVLGVEDGDAKLKEYNVTIGSGKLAQVILQGRYNYITTDKVTGRSQNRSANTYAYGKAYLVDKNDEKVEGRSEKPDQIVSASGPKNVENAARRALVSHYMGRKNGNIVINGGASEEKGELIDLAVGDLVAASAEIEKHCQRKVDTGIFTVQSIQHRLDQRRGWLIDVGVAALPAAKISSESWIQNPETDERWDSVDEYAVDNNL
jgi:hypothetical protein